MNQLSIQNFRNLLNKIIGTTMSKNYPFYGQTSKDYSLYQNDHATKNQDLSYRKFDPYESTLSYNSPKIANKYSMQSPRVYTGFSKNPQSRELSPTTRSFLRHTTYLAKGQSFLGKEKQDLSASSARPKKYHHKDFQYAKTQVNFSSVSSPSYKDNLKKYDHNLYNKSGLKTKNTEQSKKQKDYGSKSGYISKTQTNQTLSPYQSYQVQNKMQAGFKKKNLDKHEFYTPKPGTIPFQNNQKMKRIYSPEIQAFKVNSPSYKKKQMQSVSIKDFILDAKLGGGKFGTVHRAIHIKTKSIYALKKIPKAILEQNMMIEQFLLEVKIQSFLKHQNILQIYGVFSDKEHLYLILEYMPNGTVYSLLKKKKQLSQQETSDKIRQIAKAIYYMHENGIVHRDIKPQNIVMSGNVCKLCDFGWATICEDRRKTYCGTFDYAAPEIIQGMQYDLSVDLWCLGVLTYQLLVGKAPFYHVSRKQTISNILNVENKKITYPAHISSKARSFIECLLRKKPEQRLTYQQLLEHSFLAEINSEQ